MTDAATLIPFLVFCLVMTVTPGPNNMMVLTAAARAGLLGAMPLIAGIAIGSALQIASVGAGLGAMIAASPKLQAAMTLAGAGFLLWIALRIAMSGPIRDEDSRQPPIGFWAGVTFQWINPKAWAVTTGATVTYLPIDSTSADILIAAMTLAFSAGVTLLIWASGGAFLQRFLRRPKFAIVFNVGAALVLIAAIVPLVIARV